MFAKVKISGVLETITGLHIGGSSAFSAIGAVDSPVIRDARTNMPMIPGSSLKGKLRTLLAKKYNQTIGMVTHNIDIASRADRMIRIEDGKISDER